MDGPGNDSDHQVQDVRGSPDGGISGSGLRLFIVEDEMILAHDLAQNLVGMGYRVAGIETSGEEAIKGILETKPDIALIDIRLRGKMDGIAVAEKLHEVMDVPVIYLTANSDALTLARAKLTQPFGYIIKPFEDRELHSTIEMAVYKHTMERALRASEVRFRTVFESAAIGIALIDMQGRCIGANPTLETMLGYSEQELMGKPLAGFALAGSAGRETVPLGELLDGSIGQCKVERQFASKSGRYIWTSMHLSLVRDRSGAPQYALSLLEDISEQKQAEDKLRLSEEQFRLISENVADMISVLDTQGRRLYNSPSFRNVLGDPEGLKGTDSFKEIHPDDRIRVRRSFEETVRTGVGQRMEYRFLLPDGSVRYIESQGSVVRSASVVSQVIVVSRDVTESKILQRQLFRAQRMESIGTLAGGIAHDLNNVLTPIMMAVQILRRSLHGNVDQRILETLETSAMRGALIVKQVLAFGRGASEDHILLQVKHIIDEVAMIASETFPKEISIVSDVPKDLWLISADATQIHQVLLNVAVNARDAMPKGGVLTFAAENITLTAPNARMHIDAKPGAYIMIAVTDTGTGIPSDILEKIFEPFFTTKDLAHGTGLGLSTASAIVKSHNGFMNVTSSSVKGTTFSIYIPAKMDREAALPEVKEADAPMGSGELILLVDDEASILEITRETLECQGYAVLTAHDGTEAIAEYAKHGAEIKAVVTDLVMPFMDGAATIRALRKMNPNAKIIAVSGLALRGDEPKDLDCEATRLMHKPYTSTHLLKILHDVLENG
jgi:hypothetical protein